MPLKRVVFDGDHTACFANDFRVFRGDNLSYHIVMAVNAQR